MKPGASKGKPGQVTASTAYRTRSLPVVVVDKMAGRLRIFHWMKVALLIFSAAIVPLIVYLKSYDLHGTMLAAWTGGLEHVDFFNWWKALCLILVLVALIGIHITQWFMTRKSLEMPRLFLPLILFDVFVLLSAITSTVPDVVFSGFVDRSEGLWVLFAYSMLCYTAFAVTKDTKTVRLILACIFCGSLVIAGIGLLQFLGFDFFQTDFGKRLILPKAYEQFMNQLTFNFGKNIMYTTVYNPNYLGSYASLLLPISWGLTLTWAEIGKKRNLKDAAGKIKGNPAGEQGTTIRTVLQRYKWVVGVLFSLAIFILWLGSMSRAGLLGGAVAMAVFLLLQARSIVRNPIPSVCLIAGMVGMYLFMNAASGGLIKQEFQKTLPSSVQQALGQTPVTEESVTAAPVALPLPEGTPSVAPTVKVVSLKDNRFTLATETETLQMVMEKTTEGALHFYDVNSSPLALVQAGTEPASQTFADKRYAAYKITVQKDQFSVAWYQYTFLFSNNIGVMTYSPKPNTLWTEMEPAPFIGFVGHERFATNRGWIWSRTFPLLGKAIFIGYGPDTFAVFYPQKDVAWKMNLYGAANIVVDKPHNWFLQTAVNTGIVSLLLLLWFLAGILLDGLRLRFAKPVKGMEALFGDPVTGGITGTGSIMGSGSITASGNIAGSGNMSEDRETIARNVLLTGIICGVVGYALAGVFNDSVVSVAPVFWTVLGLGIGMLRFSTRAAARVKG